MSVLPSTCQVRSYNLLSCQFGVVHAADVSVTSAIGIRREMNCTTNGEQEQRG